jgi:protein-tyrosine-phosphatase
MNASIAFICTANRCRSLMAHAILEEEAKRRSLPIKIYSAGVLDFSDQPQLDETAMSCFRHQTSPPKNAPTWAGQLPLASINRFLVMEHYHAEMLMNEFDVPADRITLLGAFDPRQRGAEIADPFGGGDAIYDRQYRLIRDCIIRYLDTADELK